MTCFTWYMLDTAKIKRLHFTDNAVFAVYYLCLFPLLVNINRGAGVFWVCSFRHFFKKDFYLKH